MIVGSIARKPRKNVIEMFFFTRFDGDITLIGKYLDGDGNVRYTCYLLPLLYKSVKSITRADLASALKTRTYNPEIVEAWIKELLESCLLSLHGVQYNTHTFFEFCTFEVEL